MSLKDKLTEDLKQAMRQGDKQRRSTLRLVMAAIKNAEIEKRRELEEGELLAIIAKEAKQRHESIAQFERGGRQDLADREEAELQILLAYLPEQLSREEIEAQARQIIAEVGAASPAQMGQVMRRLMPLMQGKADGKLVSRVVKELLAGRT
jgi:uncharacterized protein YqeY